MNDLEARTPSARAAYTRTVARWMVTFIGFPLGGFATMLLIGPVQGVWTALAGGVITGSILGAVQAWGLGRNGPPALAWVAATAVGLTVGLGFGSAIVGYGTSLADLLVQGAVTGFAVGAAQAVVLRDRLGRTTFALPLALAAVWAVGWAVTTSIGVQVDQQFTVFGSAGAIVVTALTAFLPIWINRTDASAS